MYLNLIIGQTEQANLRSPAVVSDHIKPPQFLSVLQLVCSRQLWYIEGIMGLKQYET